MMALGIAKQEAESIYSTQPEHDVRDAIAYTIARRDDPKLPVLKTPAAYFKDALKGRWGEKKKAIKAPVAVKPGNPPALLVELDPELERQRQSALASFDALDESGQAQKLAEFVEANPALRKSVIKNPQSKSVRSSLAGWLRTQS